MLKKISKLLFSKSNQIIGKRLEKGIIDNNFSKNNQIIGKRLEKEIIDNNAAFSCIATMPRSGTWMTKFFFYSYNRFLSNLTIEHDKIPDFNHYDKIGIATHHSHTIFPSFPNIYTSEYRHGWDCLNFYVNGYNYGYNFLETNKKYFYQQQNPDVRIVYIYRNPLDQAVSFFRHVQHHKDERNRYIVKNGEKKYFRDVNDFIKKAGISSYLKQFLSFYLVSEQFTDQLLLVPYEELKRNTEDTYKKILLFLGHEIPQHKYDYFLNALRFIDAENLMALELKLGHCIGDDQSESNESHMRGGQIGKWKNHLSDNTLNFVQQKLEEFGLSLDFFIIQ